MVETGEGSGSLCKLQVQNNSDAWAGLRQEAPAADSQLSDRRHARTPANRGAQPTLRPALSFEHQRQDVILAPVSAKFLKGFPIRHSRTSKFKFGSTALEKDAFSLRSKKMWIRGGPQFPVDATVRMLLPLIVNDSNARNHPYQLFARESESLLLSI